MKIDELYKTDVRGQGFPGAMQKKISIVLRV